MKSDIYMYVDIAQDQIIIGTRGRSEYKVSLREYNRWLLNTYNDLKIKTQDDVLKMALKYAIEESQSIDFEPVVEIKGLLS